MRLDDFADRLGDLIEAIRANLDGHEDVAVVDARESGSGCEALLIATRRGILVAYPWAGPGEVVASIVPSGWVSWGDARASTVQTIAASGATGAAGGAATATAVASHHSCTILLRGVGLTAQGDGDQGRRAVDAFHDEVVRRGTPWHYPS